MSNEHFSGAPGSSNRRARRSSASRRALWAATIAASAAASRPARAADVYYYNLTPPGATSSPAWNTSGLSYWGWYDQSANTYTSTLQPPSASTARVMLNGTIGISNSTVVFNSFYATGTSGLKELTIDSGNTINQNTGTSQLSVTGSEIFGQNNTYGTETIGLNGAGTYIQSAGTNIADNFFLGSNAGSVGTYSISGGTFQGSSQSPSDSTIGNAGTGTFNQSGGTVSGVFFLGNAAGGVGTFNLSGGTETGSFTMGVAANATGTLSMSNGATLSTTNIAVGHGGSGTFNVTGGTLSVTGRSGAASITVGNMSTGTGLWNISGGTSSVSGVDVGFNGSGTLQMSGGTLRLFSGSSGTHPGILEVNTGGGSSAYGNVIISGGSLTVDVAEQIGFAGQASYSQTGGTNSTPLFVVGALSTGTGSATLNGGLLSTGTTQIGYNSDGSFLNSSGTHLTTTLQIGNSNTLGALYTLAGGNLSVATDELIGAPGVGSFTQTGGFQSVSTNGAGALWIGGFTSGGLVTNGAGTFNLSGGTTSASRAVYVGYRGSGTVTQTGGTLMIPAAAGTNGVVYIGYSNSTSGVYNLSGTSSLLQVSSTGGEWVGFSGNGFFNQSGGSNVATTLNITASFGTSQYNISDGTLTATNLQLFGGAAFNQSGGTVNISSSLVLGGNTGISTQSYSLSNGAVLSVTGSESIGTTSSRATFNQTGGNHTVNGTMLLGTAIGGTGTFNLSGGQLLVTGALTAGATSGASGTFNVSGGQLIDNATIIIGGTNIFGGNGFFNQSAGSVAANSLTISSPSGTTCDYSMSNGASLTVTGTESVAAYNTGSKAVFIQNGGSNTVGTLNVAGTNQAIGTYTLSQTAGATAVLMVLSAENIAGFTSANGTFTQSDGSHFVGSATARANLVLGGASSSVGVYNMTGGTLDVSGDMPVGAVSTGNFSLSSTANVTIEGATNAAVVDHGLTFGHSAGAKGNGTMTGGTLTTLNTFVGASGIGLMNQSGGTHHADSLILGYATGSSGTYTLSGGTLLVDGNEQIGASGRATFTQSGGTHTVGGTLSVKAYSTGSGTYTLQNGLLSTATLTNNGTFSMQNGSALATSTINNGSFSQSGGSSSLGVLSGGGIVTLSGSAAVMTLDSMSQSSLIVSAGRLAFNFAASSATNVASHLSITGSGVVDLNNQGLLTSSTATIQQYLTNGYNGGAWNGTGGISSSWAAADTNHARALGYKDNGDGTTLVAATLYGDTTLKGSVGLSDYNTLAANFNKPGTWSQGDFDYDGTVTLGDYNKLAANFNKSATQSASINLRSLAKPATLTSSASPSANPAFVDPGAGKVALEADPSTGKLYIVGHDSNINSYEVDSASGKLGFQTTKNHGGYNTLTAQTTTGSLAGSSNPNEDTWSLISNGPGTFVAEAYPAQDNPAFDTIGPGLQDFDLNTATGSAWTAGTPISDLTFKYGDGTGATLTPAVIDLSAVPEPASLSLIALAAGGMLSRRKRRRD